MLFWEFSNKVYKVKGVPDACLKLQDIFNMDVNMILFCYWHGTTYGSIEKNLFNQCHKFSEEWSSKSIKPIRNIRIWLKNIKNISSDLDIDTCNNYREKIKLIELDAEKIQQNTIQSFCAQKIEISLTDTDKINAIAQNIKLYLNAKKIVPTDQAIIQFNHILNASIQHENTALFKAMFHKLIV